MICMYAQTRLRFILSSERVLGGMEFEPMLTPREKSPLPENFPRGGSNPRRCGQQAQTLPASYSGPPNEVNYVKMETNLFQEQEKPQSENVNSSLVHDSGTALKFPLALL